MPSREHVDGVVALLEAEGLLDATKIQQAKALLWDFLKPDYIPKNPIGCPADRFGREDIINVRLAPPGVRCARSTSYDDQSGPIYCGDVAAVMADSKNCDGAYYILCRRCWKHTRLPAPKKEIP